jgi:hypothetical protein
VPVAPEIGPPSRNHWYPVLTPVTFQVGGVAVHRVPVRVFGPVIATACVATAGSPRTATMPPLVDEPGEYPTRDPVATRVSVWPTSSGVTV